MSVSLPTVPTTKTETHGVRWHPTFLCAGCGEAAKVTQVCAHCGHEYCEACYAPWFGLCCNACRLDSAPVPATPLMVVTASWAGGSVSAIVQGDTWQVQLDELHAVAPTESTWRADWQGDGQMGPMLEALVG